MPLILGANSVSGGYEIDNSLRFNSASTDYLNRTNGTPTGTTKYTFSTWLKISKLSSRGQFFRVINPSSTATYAFLETDGDNFFGFTDYNGTSSLAFTTTAVFRDVSAWYHLLLAVDTTQATSTNRWKFYVNGVEVTSFASTSYGTQNQTIMATSSGKDANIGGDPVGAGATRKFDGYMSDVFFIDGQQLTPSSFGETDEDTGIWKPKAYTGTYGTNGFYLQFKNSASLGTDSSGNGNTFTVNNLTSIDQTTDTPTNNFATFNNILAMNSTTSIAEGNLKATSPSTYASGASNSWFSTIGFTKGKWYAEFKPTTTPNENCLFGIGFDLSNAQQGTATSQYNFAYSTFGFAYQGTGGVGNDSVGYSAIADTYTANDIIGIAVDVDNSKLYVSKNGVFQNSSNPSAGTGGYTITADKEYFFAFADNEGVNVYVTEANFGNPPFTISSGNADANGYGNFEYAVPSGYFALCTKNLAQYG
jgi:hypothetical protein